MFFRHYLIDPTIGTDKEDPNDPNGLKGRYIGVVDMVQDGPINGTKYNSLIKKHPVTKPAVWAAVSKKGAGGRLDPAKYSLVRYVFALRNMPTAKLHSAPDTTDFFSMELEPVSLKEVIGKSGYTNPQLVSKQTDRSGREMGKHVC